MSRKQPIKNDAQGIDVARRGDGFAANLLRTGVLRGHGTKSGGAQLDGLEKHLRRQQLRDAKIEQLGGSASIHQNIAGLEVSVNDEVLVRILDRRADLTEKLQALDDVEAAAVAIFIYWLTFDVLHYQVGQPVFCGSAVQQAGNVWALQAGHNLALIAEAAEILIGGEPSTNHLDGDMLQVVVIDADRPVDDAHAALTDLRNCLARTDFLPKPRIRPRLRRQSSCQMGWTFKQGASFVVMLQKGFHFLAKRRLGRAKSVKIYPPLFGRKFERGLERLLDLFPLLGDSRQHLPGSFIISLGLGCVQRRSEAKLRLYTR